MEAKKNPGADLEKTRGLFMNVGFILALLVVIGAFKYNSGEPDVADLGEVQDTFEEMQDIPLTEQPPPPPPPPPVPPEPVPVPEEEIQEEIEEYNFESDFDEDTEIIEFAITEEIEEEVADEIFDVVEDQPEFPGGEAALYGYLAEKIKYPSQARRMGIEGRVYVQFVVDQSGNITDVVAVRGIGAGCDEEAVRVVKGMPKWTPGRQRGRAVKVKMIVPITFKLG
ncbi:MAG TPA: energy transducer TonB [Cytophagales bacterium]|nr:energy transducer TonB [Cytophagales bacterium]